MMSSIIEMRGVSRSYRIPISGTGVWGRMKGLLRPQSEERAALTNVSFAIKPGEMVGYIGPNGAGKSTTIKLLTGIIAPTAGDLSVYGLAPFDNRMQLTRKIGVLMGQRSQLWWDLPVADSFDMLKLIYDIPKEIYSHWKNTLIELMDLGSFLHQPVRLLSLGQRMRAEVVATFLHRPEIVFLDEPTIGLDILTKQKVLDLLLHMNTAIGTTVVLTTHDLTDVEKVCSRLLLLEQGELRFNGSVSDLMEAFGPRRRVRIEPVGGKEPVLSGQFQLIDRSISAWEYIYDTTEISPEQALDLVAQSCRVKNVTFPEIDLSMIVRSMYAKQGDNHE